jgi:hypothetical protein
MLANMTEMAVREIEASHAAAKQRRQEALLLRAVDALTMPFMIVNTSSTKWDLSYVNGAASDLIGVVPFPLPLTGSAVIQVLHYVYHHLGESSAQLEDLIVVLLLGVGSPNSRSENLEDKVAESSVPCVQELGETPSSNGGCGIYFEINPL